MEISFNSIEERLQYLDELAGVDSNPPRKCTKYEFVMALKRIDMPLYQTLYGAYQQNPELQFMWNTVNELDRDNEDFIGMTGSLQISEEKLDALFHAIGVGRVALAWKSR